ncbi:MAG: thermonuclease family protein [Elstera sp.]
MIRLLALLGACLVLQTLPARATAQKVEKLDGQTLVLAGGQRLWLLGVWGPQPGAEPSQGEPGAAEAEGALAADAVGRRAIPATLLGPDRSGRFGAIVTLEGDSASLNERLVRGGWARAYLLPGLPKTDDPGSSLLPLLLKAEAAARAEGRGLWQFPAYRVRQAGAEDLWPLRDQFHLVEGRVRRLIKRAGSGADLTLGDGRSALKLVISSPAGRLLKARGLDPHDLMDTKLRVRGWISVGGGLAITLERPEYLEKLP